jgi:hypothetical protein
MDNMQNQLNKRVRLEIIMSEAVQEDFLTEMDFAVPGFRYTLVPEVKGKGYTTPKQGDAVWPQLNTMLIIYCTEEEAARALVIVKGLREKYPTEGAACYKSYAEEL